MDVKYIIEAKYANGDSYADKVDTIDEVISILHFIAGAENAAQTDDNRIEATQLSVTTEEA